MGSTAPTRSGTGSQENHGFRCEYVINLTVKRFLTYTLNDAAQLREHAGFGTAGVVVLLFWLHNVHLHAQKKVGLIYENY